MRNDRQEEEPHVVEGYWHANDQNECVEYSHLLRRVVVRQKPSLLYCLPGSIEELVGSWILEVAYGYRHHHIMAAPEQQSKPRPTSVCDG